MDFPFAVFLVIVVAGVFGAIAVMPYAFTINREQLKNVPMSKPKLIFLSIVQATVLISISTSLGLLMASEVNLGAPVLEAIINGEGVPSNFGNSIVLAVLVGGVASILVVAINQFVLLPHLPEALGKAQPKLALWKRFLAGFYGGITEEILTRLFLMTLVTWLLSHIWTTSNGTTADGAYWTGIIVAAILFGLGHLPATRALTPLTPLVIFRTLLLNGIIAIGTGYLYWQYGLLTAMIAHFTADMVLHVFAPFFIHNSNSVEESNNLHTISTQALS